MCCADHLLDGIRRFCLVCLLVAPAVWFICYFRCLFACWRHSGLRELQPDPAFVLSGSCDGAWVDVSKLSSFDNLNLLVVVDH